MNNVIAFCADTCNTMFEIKHSVSQLLVSNYPWILPVKCSCHLIHLCSAHSSLKLPKSLEDLCRNIYSYFHVSSQRRNVLEVVVEVPRSDQEPHVPQRGKAELGFPTKFQRNINKNIMDCITRI